MNESLSNEMKNEIINMLDADLASMRELLHYTTSANNRIPSYDRLERMAYITEQIRLKLKLLGAPKLYN